ncbi:MAG: hypothetical protein JWO73_48 [Candidatus Taylorbacteria bacterium]|nr:hypothetical protein [Candidatus Taylorbacteria bacterium]
MEGHRRRTRQGREIRTRVKTDRVRSVAHQRMVDELSEAPSRFQGEMGCAESERLQETNITEHSTTDTRKSLRHFAGVHRRYRRGNSWYHESYPASSSSCSNSSSSGSTCTSACDTTCGTNTTRSTDTTRSSSTCSSGRYAADSAAEMVAEMAETFQIDRSVRARASPRIRLSLASCPQYQQVMERAWRETSEGSGADCNSGRNQ